MEMRDILKSAWRSIRSKELEQCTAETAHCRRHLLEVIMHAEGEKLEKIWCYFVVASAGRMGRTGSGGCFHEGQALAKGLSAYGRKA